MIRYRLIATFGLVLLAAGGVSAGPELDRALDYMFMDQSVPMKGPQLLFYNEREIQDKLAMKLLDGEFKEGEKILVDADSAGQIVFEHAGEVTAAV